MPQLVRVYLQDEAPKIGSGWRKVILTEERDRMRIRDPITGARKSFSFAVWNEIAKSMAKSEQPKEELTDAMLIEKPVNEEIDDIFEADAAAKEAPVEVEIPDDAPCALPRDLKATEAAPVAKRVRSGRMATKPGEKPNVVEVDKKPLKPLKVLEAGLNELLNPKASKPKTVSEKLSDASAQMASALFAPDHKRQAPKPVSVAPPKPEPEKKKAAKPVKVAKPKVAKAAAKPKAPAAKSGDKVPCWRIFADAVKKAGKSGLPFAAACALFPDKTENAVDCFPGAANARFEALGETGRIRRIGSKRSNGYVFD
jgi:hypothetical protein